MFFNDRKEFLYDPDVFKRVDTKTALQIHEEYTRKHSARPVPRFFEVDRRSTLIDELWHIPLTDRTTFSRQLEIPCIHMFEKPLWKLTRIGTVPLRHDNFMLSNNVLQAADYFPMRGDQIYWQGYRYMIEQIIMPPDAYWQQTNVWMGLVIHCIVPPDGDARPIADTTKPAPSESAPEITTIITPPQPPFTPLKPGKQGL